MPSGSPWRRDGYSPRRSGGAGRGPEEGKKGAGVDESGGPRDGMGEDEAPAAGMLRGNVEWSGMGRVRRLQDGYERIGFSSRWAYRLQARNHRTTVHPSEPPGGTDL